MALPGGGAGAEPRGAARAQGPGVRAVRAVRACVRAAFPGRRRSAELVGAMVLLESEQVPGGGERGPRRGAGGGPGPGRGPLSRCGPPGEAPLCRLLLQFLTELTRLFQKCRTSGSVFITLKKCEWGGGRDGRQGLNAGGGRDTAPLLRGWEP